MLGNAGGVDKRDFFLPKPAILLMPFLNAELLLFSLLGLREGAPESEGDFWER